jgi:hypothetical protein
MTFKIPTTAKEWAMHVRRYDANGMQNLLAEAIEAQAAELDRLRGQRLVLLELLGDAAHVIHNLPDEVETQEEADMLHTLKDRIADARGAMLLELAA